MKINVTKKKWASATQLRALKKLADHASKHYPMDKELHAAVRGAFQVIDEAASMQGAPARKGGPSKKASKRTRTAAKPRRAARKTSARKVGGPRRNARRAPAKSKRSSVVPAPRTSALMS